MNISSGMMATGFPAMTAIGGFVHSLERKTGQDIDFAIGIKHADWVAGVPKITTYKTSRGSFSGRVIGGKVTPAPGFGTEEMVANCEIVLLLKTKTNPEALVDILKNVYRIAGGTLFDVDISTVTDGTPPTASYLADASTDIDNWMRRSRADSLRAALELYSKGGDWEDEKWVQKVNEHTLNHTGYAFLEKPIDRHGSRGNYPHAWAESTFSLIGQRGMDDDCWWSREANSSGVFWKGSANE